MKISLDISQKTNTWVFNVIDFLEALVREDEAHSTVAKQLLYDFENEIKSQLVQKLGRRKK